MDLTIENDVDLTDTVFDDSVYIEDSYGYDIALMCSTGVLQSIQGQIWTLFALATVQRLISISYFPAWLKHLSIATLGVWALRLWIPEEQFGHVVVAIFLAASAILLVPIPVMPFIVTLLTIVALVVGEHFVDLPSFTSYRGCLMVLAMRLSALSFESTKTSSGTSGVSALAAISYLLNPATVIFGPFVTLQQHVDSVNTSDSVKGIMTKAVCAVGLLAHSLLFLVVSSCAQVAIGAQTVLLDDYLTAQSFRFSHYFVCFLAAALAWTAGCAVASPRVLSVEFPRSMTSVVVGWDINMHRYLHEYVYKPTRRFGTAFAILFTFTVSSLLHGGNFQLTAVLLSLGTICFVENRLRNRLSVRLCACVRSRSCDVCNHKHTSLSPRTLLINGFFFVLNVYHLIYLGMPFNGEGAEHGYSAQHTIEVWSRHHFASHLLTLATGIAAFLL